ncbi:MAG TPA: FAD-dependent oxidoreductase, partial [Vicinamibacterales bacterium]|nr:FAD-dependent oxidoreductase [Vicinamibacterales bacterium]
MNDYDAIVIGGGPSGSTAAALLAEHGHRVLLLEREPFPRYHIGESLIPYTWFTLNRLGVVDWLRKSACPKKYSVQFVSITGKVSQPFYFFQTIRHECSQTWQVWRGEFDRMLLDNARSKGADVRQHV